MSERCHPVGACAVGTQCITHGVGPMNLPVTASKGDGVCDHCGGSGRVLTCGACHGTGRIPSPAGNTCGLCHERRDDPNEYCRSELHPSLPAAEASPEGPLRWVEVSRETTDLREKLRALEALERLADKLTAVTAERDELCGRLHLETEHSATLEAELTAATAERDKVERAWKTDVQVHIEAELRLESELTAAKAERDEWIARADQLGNDVMAAAEVGQRYMLDAAEAEARAEKAEAAAEISEAFAEGARQTRAHQQAQLVTADLALAAEQVVRIGSVLRAEKAEAERDQTSEAWRAAEMECVGLRAELEQERRDHWETAIELTYTRDMIKWALASEREPSCGG